MHTNTHQGYVVRGDVCRKAPSGKSKEKGSSKASSSRRTASPSTGADSPRKNSEQERRSQGGNGAKTRDIGGKEMKRQISDRDTAGETDRRRQSNELDPTAKITADDSDSDRRRQGGKDHKIRKYQSSSGDATATEDDKRRHGLNQGGGSKGVKDASRCASPGDCRGEDGRRRDSRRRDGDV
jgi:hypothetical protein